MEGCLPSACCSVSVLDRLGGASPIAPTRLGGGVTGAAERLDVYEHAAGLGGGFEALLGFAEGALDAGHGHEGRVYVAASRSAHPWPSCRRDSFVPPLPPMHAVSNCYHFASWVHWQICLSTEASNGMAAGIHSIACVALPQPGSPIMVGH